MESVVVVVSVTAIVVALAIGAFVVGARVSAASAHPSVTGAAASASPSSPAARTAPSPSSSAAGTVVWSALVTGQCLTDYDSPWQPSYHVVACSSMHTAQMTLRTTYADAAYPGTSALVQRLSLACSSAEAIRLGPAGRYGDLRIAFSYPTESDWAGGQRHGFCFVTRASGGTISGDLAAA